MKALWLAAIASTILAPPCDAHERGYDRSLILAQAAPPAAQRLAAAQKKRSAAARPTAAEAKAFVAEVEAAYSSTNAYNNRVSWMKSTFNTIDTNWLEALALADSTRQQLEFSKRAARYSNITVDAVTRRKLDKIKLGAALLPPDRPNAAEEMAELTTRLDSSFATLAVPWQGKSLPRDEAEEVIGKLRDPGELETLWTAMSTNLPPMRKGFEQVVALSNQGARTLGFKDTGEMWRSAYDMPPAEFAALVERLWKQVEPLYKNLHCYRRARLSDTFGNSVQPRTGPIRQHLLAPKWETVSDIYLPRSDSVSVDLTKLLVERGYDVPKMFKDGEAFFTSLGFAALPQTFWTRSMFTRPPDREISCWANAWDIDGAGDVRISGCFRINADDFYTAHHELGHIYYYLATGELDTMFADGANDGFHEAVGDFITLSARTQTYLQQIGLLDRDAPQESDLAFLMRMLHAHGGVMAFNMAIETWRWDVFAGKFTPEQYNDAWWQRRRQYLGVVPPAPRPREAFDPGGVYHVATFQPSIRYFLAEVYQFQFHRAACRIAGWNGPLHRCSIYGNKEVGERFKAMLRMGSSRPWPEALAAFTGDREMDASAILDYFAPLDRWLTEQNKGEACGW